MSSYLEKNEEALYRLLRSYLRAEEYMQTHMDEVSDLVVKNLDLKKETVDSFVLSPHMKDDTDPYTKSVKKMWEKMANFGYLTAGNVNLDEPCHLPEGAGIACCGLPQQPVLQGQAGAVQSEQHSLIFFVILG